MAILWNGVRAKVQLRLAVQRLRTTQEKLTAMQKSSRRDIASLIERQKLETARIKVESLIHEDVYIELLELLELYCELLIARFGMLDIPAREPDPGITEAVNAIIHAAPRTEVKELLVLRELLTHKYGREYSLGVMENRDLCVPARVVSKLGLGMPSPELVDAYLAEIARGYGVEWEAPDRYGKAGGDGEDGAGDGEGGVREEAESKVEKERALEPPLPESLAPNPLPSVPHESGTKPAVQFKPSSPTVEKNQEDEFEVLSKRFAALKKR
ncbi:DUF292-domain-containing protein [Calocera cornea HHB12733]|uniref:DUF292-domain-containing protein n=1 Tax=Calocera cornea HHB12733 TaxID=1353952 RepID=A0A165F3N2_9BASI|nr:DUF292-domain-containing protein [Calocera cornea HHB12733]